MNLMIRESHRIEENSANGDGVYFEAHFNMQNKPFYIYIQIYL